VLPTRIAADGVAPGAIRCDALAEGAVSVAESRGRVSDGLAGTLFPKIVLPPPPPPTEIVELVAVVDVEAWAIEHELTRDGHECEDLLLRYCDQAKPAVYCPECRLLVGAQHWSPVMMGVLPRLSTHAETAVLVLRANVGTAILLGLVAWLTWLGFTTAGLALLIAAGLLAAYVTLGWDR
jgi:hypothetical protein